MNNSRLVYSTDGGRVRPGPEQPPQPNRAGGRNVPKAPDDGVVRLFRERGGRGGKVVTVIRGLPERGEHLAALAGELKRLCGSGGAMKDTTIEIQGDHRERIAAWLRDRGYTVKPAGG